MGYNQSQIPMSEVLPKTDPQGAYYSPVLHMYQITVQLQTGVQPKTDPLLIWGTTKVRSPCRRYYLRQILRALSIRPHLPKFNFFNLACTKCWVHYYTKIFHLAFFNKCPFTTTFLLSFISSNKPAQQSFTVLHCLQTHK